MVDAFRHCPGTIQYHHVPPIISSRGASLVLISISIRFMFCFIDANILCRGSGKVDIFLPRVFRHRGQESKFVKKKCTSMRWHLHLRSFFRASCLRCFWMLSIQHNLETPFNFSLPESTRSNIAFSFSSIQDMVCSVPCKLIISNLGMPWYAMLFRKSIWKPNAQGPSVRSLFLQCVLSRLQTC